MPSGGAKVTSYVQDGIAFVQSTKERYDLVMSDGFVLSSEISTKLYTRDHFRNVRRILAPGGLLVTWIPTNVGAETCVEPLPSSRNLSQR